MKLSENVQHWIGRNMKVNWSVSRARETDGWNICTLRDGWINKKLASCNGGGYDMIGTVFAIWLTSEFKAELCALKPKQFPENEPGSKYPRSFYGLTFHNPNYDPGKALIKGKDGKMLTVEEAEKAGESLGLERYQQCFAASSKTPSKVFNDPYMDGAAGFESVKRVMNAIGFDIECLDHNMGLYRVVAYDKNRRY